MFDHNIFQENLVGVDYCERMVKETNPGVLERANRTEAPHAGDHGYRTIGDIMRSLNPLEGDFYREALQVSRYTREMFCLMEGRHVHPSTLYPGGVGTVADDPALHRLPDPADALRRVHEEGRAAARRPVRLLLRGAARLRARRRAPDPARLLGQPQRPGVLRLHVPDTWTTGAGRCSSPRASSSTASSSPTTWSTSTSASGSCSGTRTTRTGPTAATRSSSTSDPLGNPVDVRHPWNQHTLPKPAKRDFDNALQLDDVAALVRRHGPPRARHRRRPDRPAVVDGPVRPGRHRLRQGHRAQRGDQPAADRAEARGHASSGRSRSGATRSSATGPAPTSRPTRPRWRCTSARRRSAEVRAGQHRDLDAVRGAGRGGLRAASPRRSAACSATTW